MVEYALDVLQRVDAGGNVLWQAKIMQDSSTATAPHRAVPVASLYEYRKP